MSKLKTKLKGGTTWPPQFIVVANDKGGQGKSLSALSIADHAFLHQARLEVAQVDAQQRLASVLARQVLTIKSVGRDARRDPGADARAFTPFYELLLTAAGCEASVLLDVGANQVQRTAVWCGLVDLDEDLTAWGFETTLVVPFVAEGEGIRQAAKTAEQLKGRFPNARLVLIENERDGAFTALHSASEAAAAYRAVIEPLKAQALTLRMPAIEAGSWRAFEAAGCRLIDVPQMPPDKVVALTGLPLPEAKIVIESPYKQTTNPRTPKAYCPDHKRYPFMPAQKVGRRICANLKIRHFVVITTRYRICKAWL